MPKQQEFNKQGKPLSMSASAVASRRKRANAKNGGNPAAPADPPGNGGNGNGGGDQGSEANTGKIGVQSPVKPKPQYYHCDNCDEDVTMGMTICPTCGINLNWPE